MTYAAIPSKWVGSIWVKCDAKGEAECPHCQIKGFYRGDKWAACKHAIGPGTVGDSPAMIFKREKDK